MTSNLQRAVVALIKDSSAQQWRDMADGAGISYPWVRQLAKGKIVNAGADSLEKLHLHLTGSRYPAE